MSSIENSSHLLSSYGSSGRTRHHSRASWPLNDYVHRPTLALVCPLCASLDFELLLHVCWIEILQTECSREMRRSTLATGIPE
jgi:hypothetical protein